MSVNTNKNGKIYVKKTSGANGDREKSPQSRASNESGRRGGSPTSCMTSQKNEKPSLSGQRIKTRKRDEKERYDDIGFRDAILKGFAESFDSDTDDIKRLEAAYKFLDGAGSKLDYRRYGEVLFDILIAGGILAPGGTLLACGGEPGVPSKICVFNANNNESLKGYAQLFVKILRRYKYLEKTIIEEWKKVLLFLRGFDTEQRQKLASVTGSLIVSGLLPPQVLLCTLQDHQVKEGIALKFYLDTLQVLQREKKDAAMVWSLIKKGKVDEHFLDFFPASKRTDEIVAKTLIDAGLASFLQLYRARANAVALTELKECLEEILGRSGSSKDCIRIINEAKHNSVTQIPEHEMVGLFWEVFVNSDEWSGDGDATANPMIRHLKQYGATFAYLTTTVKSELYLLSKIQEYCYENAAASKLFSKMVILFYKMDVLTEDAILQWYGKRDNTKGKSIFVSQMTPFIEWLQNAEEEDDDEQENAHEK